jgi:hypothetical protein
MSTPTTRSTPVPATLSSPFPPRTSEEGDRSRRVHVEAPTEELGQELRLAEPWQRHVGLVVGQRKVEPWVPHGAVDHLSASLRS